MQKILFIGNFLSEAKGTKAVAESISESILKEDFEFHLVSRYKSRILRLLDMFWQLLRFSGRNVHIDVFSGRAFLFTAVFSRIAVLRRKRVLMTLHGGALPEYTAKKKNFVLKVFDRADYIQTPSRYLKQYFHSLGMTVSYLPNPINLSRFQYDRSVVKPQSLLWVRAFTSIYGPDIPIRVLSLLQKDFPGATLTMVGPDKGLRRSIEELTDELGLSEHVNFVGSVVNDELYKYYQSHHVFLNTTAFESFGVAVVEAAACGIPIVSNVVGEIPYIWDKGVNMLFVEGNRIDRYVEHVKNIFNDRELEIKLSKNARLNAETFDQMKIVGNWKNILQ